MKTTYVFFAAVLFLSIGYSFIGTNGAYGVEPGTFKWSFLLSTALNLGSVAVDDDGTIYVGTRNGRLYALNPDGSEKWSYDTGDEFVNVPAIGNDGTVYLCTRYFHDLYAFNPDGSVRWTFAAMPGPSGAPAIAKDGRIFVGAGSSLYAFTPDGEVVLDFPTGGMVKDPVIDINGNIYFISFPVMPEEATLFAVNTFGWYLWSYKFPVNFAGSLAIGNGGRIYVSMDKLYAFWPNGDLSWTFPTDNNSYHPSAPSIGADGTIYVSGSGWFYAVNPDGTEKWHIVTARQEPPSALIGKDGTAYLTLTMNALFAMNPVEPYMRWYFGTDAQIYSSPALSDDGTLYMVDEFRVIALYTDSYGPANSSWPMYRANNKRTARIDKYWFAINNIRRLLRRVKADNLKNGIKRSLVAKLDSSVDSLLMEKVTPAVNKLNAFANEVEALAGKKISMEEAEYLAVNAREIADSLRSFMTHY